MSFMLSSLLAGGYLFIAVSTALAFYDGFDSPAELVADLLVGLLWPFILTSILIRRLFRRRTGIRLL